MQTLKYTLMIENLPVLSKHADVVYCMFLFISPSVQINDSCTCIDCSILHVHIALPWQRTLSIWLNISQHALSSVSSSPLVYMT